MHSLRRLIAVCTLIAPCLLLMATPTQAGIATVLCCRCQSPTEGKTDVCYKYLEPGTTSDGLTCTITSAPNDPTGRPIACNAIPLSSDQCQLISGSTAGRCSQIIDASKPVIAEKASERFKPVIPELSIPIPGLDFARELSISGAGPDEVIHLPFLSQYISAVYSYLVGISAIAAAIMIVYGGFLYIVGGTMGKVSAGKEIIQDAVIGLVLIFSLYTIISTINPDIVGLSSLKLRYVASVPLTIEETEDWGDSMPEVAGEAPKAICRTIESCRKMCDEDAWPTEWSGTMDPDLAKPIPDMDGIVGNGHRASQMVIDGLRRAGAIAKKENKTIYVRSGYRPLRKQIYIVCHDYMNKGAAREALIGSSVAWPGASNHGAGTAVDIALYDNAKGKFIVNSTCDAQKAGGATSAEASKLFDKIMTSGAGAVRYANETWHYEFGGTTKSCRCTYPNCPSPPMRSCKGYCQ